MRARPFGRSAAADTAEPRPDQGVQTHKELRLAPLIGYSVVGQVVYLLSQLVVLAALAQLRGADAVGEFGLALALTTPFFMFVSMGGKTSQASDVIQRYSFAEYAGLVFVLAALATAASIAVALVFASTEHALLIVVIVALTKAAESISSLSYGAFQQAGRPDKISVSLLIRGALTVPLFVALLWAGAPVGIAFLAQLLIWSAVAVLRDYPLASRMAAGRLVWPSNDGRRLLTLARETAPLGASHGVGALLNSLPRLYVERALGLSAVGILTIVTYLQQAGSMIISSISQPLVNRFARLRQRDDAGSIRRTMFALLALVAGCSVAGILLVAVAGKWILSTVFGPELAQADDLLMVIALALSAKLFSVLPQSLLHADRRYNTFLFREIASVLVCFALLALLVPRMGLIGAGYAILGAAIFRLVVISFAVTLAPKKQSARSADPSTFETTVA